MKDWYNKKDCEHLRAYHAHYDVPTAAMLWCQVPPDEVLEEISQTSPHPHIRGVFTHPYIPCFEVRCKIIHDAIVNKALPASRQDKKLTDDHIAPERRHVSREHLKAWIAKEHPGDKPAFLFDEIERKTHEAINADTFMALQADRDAARTELKKAKALVADTARKMNEMSGERDSLRKMVDDLAEKSKAADIPDERSKTTYQNIIAALLDCIAGDVQNVVKHPSFESEAKLIDTICDQYRGYGGLSKSNLSRKFPEAKQSMKKQ